MLLFHFSGNAQTKKTTPKTNAIKQLLKWFNFIPSIDCMTCNKNWKTNRKLKKIFPKIAFTLVNVDDAKNKKAEQFEATGTALFF